MRRPLTFTHDSPESWVEHNESEDGSFRASAEYLLTVAQMPA